MRLVFAGLAATALFLCSGAIPAATYGRAPQPRLTGTEVFAARSRPAPALSLGDQHGHLVSLRSLRGHIVALTFLDATCRQECPIAGHEMAAAQKALGHTMVTVIVSVSARDTPAQAAAFVRAVKLSGQWHWLFGSQRSLQHVWNEYGIWVRPARGDIQHTAALFLIDQRGFVRVAYAVPLEPPQLVESAQYLEAAG